MGTALLDPQEVVLTWLTTALFLCGVAYGLLVAVSRLSEVLTDAGLPVPHTPHIPPLTVAAHGDL